VTTLIDFADQKKGASVASAVRERLAQATGKCAVNYGFHCTLTDINAETLREIPALIKDGFLPLNSIRPILKADCTFLMRIWNVRFGSLPSTARSPRFMPRMKR
jgi:hypothetical protein